MTKTTENQPDGHCSTSEGECSETNLPQSNQHLVYNFKMVLTGWYCLQSETVPTGSQRFPLISEPGGVGLRGLDLREKVNESTLEVAMPPSRPNRPLAIHPAATPKTSLATAPVIGSTGPTRAPPSSTATTSASPACRLRLITHEALPCGSVVWRGGKVRQVAAGAFQQAGRLHRPRHDDLQPPPARSIAESARQGLQRGGVHGRLLNAAAVVNAP